MNTSDILKRVDHTLLTVTAIKDDFIKFCEEAVKHDVASVCVPPCRVYECRDYMYANHTSDGRKIPVCTVIGFPAGYSRTNIKTQEARDAIDSGATEIDMVANIGWIKDGRLDDVLNDIKEVRKATEGYILKVIIETAVLTDYEKKMMCEVVSKSNADFIKTSTGFASGGATFDDVELLRKFSPPQVKVKAAGGIKSIEDAVEFIKLGADRLGTSSIVKLVQGMKSDGGY